MGVSSCSSALEPSLQESKREFKRLFGSILGVAFRPESVEAVLLTRKQVHLHFAPRIKDGSVEFVREGDGNDRVRFAVDDKYWWQSGYLHFRSVGPVSSSTVVVHDSNDRWYGRRNGYREESASGKPNESYPASIHRRLRTKINGGISYSMAPAVPLLKALF